MGALRLNGSMIVNNKISVLRSATRSSIKTSLALHQLPACCPLTQPVNRTKHVREPYRFHAKFRLVRAPAPRATLIKLLPPRAHLVKVPEWQPGQARIMRMPYDDNLEVRGVLKGYLGSESANSAGQDRAETTAQAETGGQWDAFHPHGRRYTLGRVPGSGRFFTSGYRILP